MRTIEDIIAESHKATEAALREAFEAGKAHATSDLKSKVAAFFESLTAPAETHAEPHPVEAHVEPHPVETHVEHEPAPEQHMEQHQGDQHSNEHHY